MEPNMAAARKGVFDFLGCKSRFPQHRVGRLMDQDINCGLTSCVLEEGTFIKLSPSGLPLQQVFLGLTAAELIVITQEVPPIYNVNNKHDLELEGLRIDAIFPLSNVRFSLSEDRPMTFSVTTPGEKQLHFEMCKLDAGFRTNWNVWRNILDEAIENQPKEKAFVDKPIIESLKQTPSVVHSASSRSNDSSSVESDMGISSADSDDLKPHSNDFMVVPSRRLRFFFGGQNTLFNATSFNKDGEKTPSISKSSSWSDVISGCNKSTHVIDMASFRKILKRRDIPPAYSLGSPDFFESSDDISDEEDIENVFKEARSNIKTQSSKRSGAHLWCRVKELLLRESGDSFQKVLLDRTLSHVVFHAVSARKRPIARSILDCRPLEVARELTIMSRRLLLSVRPADLQQYTGSPSKHLPTSLQRITTFGDSIRKLVMAEILSSHVISHRATVLKFFIGVCYHLLFTQRDFQMLICVLRGMASLPVYRLRDTWATFFVQEPLKFCQFQALSTLLSPRDHYRSYRTQIQVCNIRSSSYIPWFDHFLVHCRKTKLPRENVVLNTNTPMVRNKPSARVRQYPKMTVGDIPPYHDEYRSVVMELHQGKTMKRKTYADANSKDNNTAIGMQLGQSKQSTAITKRKSDGKVHTQEKKKNDSMKQENDERLSAATVKDVDTKAQQKGKKTVSGINKVDDNDEWLNYPQRKLAMDVRPRAISNNTSSAVPPKSILKKQDTKKTLKKKRVFRLFKLKKRKTVKFLLSDAELVRANAMESRNSNMKHFAKTRLYPIKQNRDFNYKSKYNVDKNRALTKPVVVSTALDKFCDEKAYEIVQDVLKSTVQEPIQTDNGELNEIKVGDEVPNTFNTEQPASSGELGADTLTGHVGHHDTHVDEAVQESPKTTKKGARNWMMKKVRKRKQKKQTKDEVDHLNHLQREIDSINDLIRDFDHLNDEDSDDETAISKEDRKNKIGVKDGSPQCEINRKPVSLNDKHGASKKDESNVRNTTETRDVRRKSYVPASVYQNRRKSLFEQAYDVSKDTAMDDHFTQAITKRLRSIQGRRKSVCLFGIGEDEAKEVDQHRGNVCNNANGGNVSPQRAFKFGNSDRIKTPNVEPEFTANDATKHASKAVPKITSNTAADPIGLHRNASAEYLGTINVSVDPSGACLYCGGDRCVYSDSIFSTLIEIQARSLNAQERSSKRVRECLKMLIDSLKHLSSYDLLSMSLAIE